MFNSIVDFFLDITVSGVYILEGVAEYENGIAALLRSSQ